MRVFFVVVSPRVLMWGGGVFIFFVFHVKVVFLLETFIYNVLYFVF